MVVSTINLTYRSRVMPRFLTALVVCLVVLLLSSCATTAPPQPTFTDPTTPARTTAERQRYLAMAREYTRLATRADAPQRQDYQLRAANILALGNFTRHARQILGSMPQDALDSSQRIRKRLLSAYVAILEQNPRETLQLLAAPLPGDAPQARKADYHRLRATAYSMIGKHLHAARERVALEPLLTRRSAIENNRKAIWQSLSRTDDQSLAAVKTLPPPHQLSGWIELMRISRSARRGGQQMREQLARWQESFPGHPAGGAILAALYEQSERSLSLDPGNIALLLPLSGDLKPAGEAIRNGFIAAYYAARERGSDGERRIRIYDAGGDAIQEMYQRALADGSGLVVGPLDKRDLALLVESGVATAPTLALNYLDPNLLRLPPDLFQLGLSPEDEARQAARRIWADGYSQVGILYPATPWGQRVASAFASEWEKSGSRIVAAQSYDPEGQDFSTPVARLLKAAESNAAVVAAARRPARQQRQSDGKEGDVEDIPIGVDAIFMPGFPRQLRQLRPQLRFHDAGDVPVYATSHAYTGKPNRAMDSDLNGIRFCDMPWILDTGSGNRKLRRTIKQQFAIAPDSQLNRLYALGVDAYNLIGALASLQSQSYERFDGETGTLMMDQSGRLHRRLSWAIFERGVPRLLPEAATPQE